MLCGSTSCYVHGARLQWNSAMEKIFTGCLKYFSQSNPGPPVHPETCPNSFIPDTS